MTYKLDVIPQYAEDAVRNFNSHSAAGYEFAGLFSSLALFRADEVGGLDSGSLSSAHDAFGRQRVSEPFTLGDYKHTYGQVDLFINSASGDGTIISNVNRASTIMSVTSSNSLALHQTKMYHHYMPGKSQEILSSFIFGAPISGSTKRTGYFDDYNGIFFEQDATGSLNFVIRSATNGTGSITEHRVKQENWNVNTLLGGPVVLDISKAQLFYIDFQWLSIGRVRCGFVFKGITVICHTFDHSNVTNVAYMQNPNLPVRCEIRNSLTTASYMEQICSTVMSEGGYAEAGRAFSISSDTLRALSSGSTLPVLAIRLKNSFGGLPNRAFLRVQNASIFTDQQTIRYTLNKLQSGSMLTTSSAWTSVDDTSVVEYNTSATAYTDGKTLLSGFIGANSLNPTQANPNAGSQTGVNNKQNYLVQNYTSTDSEIYVLVAKNMTGTSTNVGASLLWSEVY